MSETVFVFFDLLHFSYTPERDFNLRLIVIYYNNKQEWGVVNMYESFFPRCT